MIKPNHIPQNGWTLLVVDTDLISKEDFHKLPWGMIVHLPAYKDAPEHDKNDLLEEIMEFSKE